LDAVWERSVSGQSALMDGMAGLKDAPGRGRKARLPADKISLIVERATRPAQDRVRWSVTHKHPAVQHWLKAHGRFHMHFTPTSSSWLNLVARFFGELTSEVAKAAFNLCANWCVRLNPIWQSVTRTQRSMSGERPVLRSWRKLNAQEQRLPPQLLFRRNYGTGH
jgi:hypothetical protein